MLYEILLENNVERILKYLGGNVKKEFKKHKTKFMFFFQTYLDDLYDKYSKTKTILYKDEPIPLSDFFVCNDLENDKYTIDANDTVKDILNLSHYIFITGSGGIGKSMLMKHFLIKIIEDKRFIPIFLELRNYSEYDGDFEEFIYYSLFALNFDLEKDYLGYALSSGCFVFLLDGLDEVKSSRYLKLCKEIEYLCTKYKSNYYIITSRPGKEYEDFFQKFIVLKCMEFSKEQSMKLISNLDYDEDIKKKFMIYLRDKLFLTHKTFASNPLLLTILLMTYHEYAEIPDKLHLFYSYAFDTLYAKHDARKGLKREFYSDLAADDFRLVLSTFCLRTYLRELYEFTSDEIRSDIREILDKKVKSKSTAEEYINDLCTSVCILIREGIRYRFAHRSFQEYFTALCIRDFSDEALIKVCNYIIYGKSMQIIHDDMILMLYDMIPDRFEESIVMPILEKIEKNKTEDIILCYTKILFPRLKISFSANQFVKFDISYNYAPINKILFAAIKRNMVIENDFIILSDKVFWNQMKQKHIKLTEPMSDILNRNYSKDFMDKFLMTRMGQMVKVASNLRVNLQRKYKEEKFLLDELLN